MADALPHQLGPALHSLEGHWSCAEHQLVSIKPREPHLGVPDPVRIRADIDVVDHGVLVGQHLERPGVGKVGADRLRPLRGGSAERILRVVGARCAAMISTDM